MPARRRRAAATGPLLALAGALAAQDQPVVLAPAWWVEPVAAALATALGERPAVVAWDPAAAAPPPGLLLADGWTLQRLLAAGRLAAAPPELAQPLPAFAVPVALGAPAGAPLAAGERTFAAVVLDRGADDRLGCVPPAVDGSVWLALADEARRRGDGEARVFAYWTTLDARCGRLAADYAALADGLATGALAAVLAPEPWFRHLPAALRQGLRWTEPGAPARWGFGLLAGAGPGTAALAVRLAAGDRLAALATALGVGADRGPWPLAPATAARWAERFDREVAGRGRATEQLADALDFWFGLLSLAALGVLLWRFRARRGESP